jgi:hypothetical protein
MRQGALFSNMGDRAHALSDLAEDLARCADADGAWQVGLQALEVAATSLRRVQMCQLVGEKFARSMATFGASHLVRDVLQLTREVCADSPHAVAVLAEIGLAAAPLLHAAGEEHEASAYVDIASRVAGQLDEDAANRMLAGMVVTLDEIGEPERALRALDAVRDPFDWGSCLRRLAERRADVRKFDEGVRLAQRSLDRLDTMDRAVDRIDTQAGAAYILARCGDIEAAQCLAGKAFEQIGSLDKQFRARPLGRIAASATLTQDRAMADRVFALARRDFELTNDSRSLIELVRGVVTAYLNGNDVANALRVWRTLLQDDQLTDLASLARALHCGVGVIATLDRGHTLIALHRALSEVRSWWQNSRPAL